MDAALLASTHRSGSLFLHLFLTYFVYRGVNFCAGRDFTIRTVTAWIPRAVRTQLFDATFGNARVGGSDLCSGAAGLPPTHPHSSGNDALMHCPGPEIEAALGCAELRKFCAMSNH